MRQPGSSRDAEEQLPGQETGDRSHENRIRSYASQVQSEGKKAKKICASGHTGRGAKCLGGGGEKTASHESTVPTGLPSLPLSLPSFFEELITLRVSKGRVNELQCS